MSRQFEDLCLKNEISHRKVSIESHKSNGRVERLIGSIREGLVKSLENIEIGKKIEKIIESYNNTYHSALKRTPNEAWEDDSGRILWQNDRMGDYARNFRKGFREQFVVGQKVRAARNENLGERYKIIKRRFLEEGTIIEKFLNDSYLVEVKGKKLKKRHHDLKGFISKRQDQTNVLPGGCGGFTLNE